MQLDQYNDYFEARKNYLELQKKELDVVCSMKRSRKIKHDKNTIKNIEQKTNDEEVQSENLSNAWIWPKDHLQHKVSSQQLALIVEHCSCLPKYCLLVLFTIWSKHFVFQTKKLRYMIEIIISFYVLTNSDSTCIFFIFCKPESTFADFTYQDCLFEVIVAHKIYHRFNTSHEFWDRLNASLKKKLGYY